MLIAEEASSLLPEKQPITVICKFRPPVTKEKEDGGTSQKLLTVSDNQKTITVAGKGPDKSFKFHRVAGETTTQEELYLEVKELVIEDFLEEGFNGTVFCYGPSGSGKSFTTFGPSALMAEVSADKGSLDSDAGLIPRIFVDVFIDLEQKTEAAADEVTYKCICSFYEISKEKVHDLLDPNVSSGDLPVREDKKKKGVYVQGLIEETVECAGAAGRLLRRGYINRQTAETFLNRESSRSHAVFTLYIEEWRDGVRRSRKRFNIVDLAGCERQPAFQAGADLQKSNMHSAREHGRMGKQTTTGDRLKEASLINLSLHALGQVIRALAAKSPHVPYRDGRLPFLLFDSLGGNSKTMMILTINPYESHVSEIVSTLEFGCLAQKVTTKAVKNKDTRGLTPGEREELEFLRQKVLLGAERKEGVESELEAQLYSLMEDNDKLRLEKAERLSMARVSLFGKKEENDQMRAELLEKQAHVTSLKLQVEEQSAEIVNLKEQHANVLADTASTQLAEEKLAELLYDEVETLKIQLNQETASKIELQEALSRVQEAMDRLNSERSEAQAAAAQAEEVAKLELTRQLQDAEMRHKTEMKASVAQATDKIVGLETCISEMDSSSTKQCEELANLQGELNALMVQHKKDKEEATEAATEVSKELETMKSQLDARDEEVEVVTQEARSLKANLEDVQSQLSVALTNSEQLASVQGQLIAQKAQQMKDNDNANAALTELSKELETVKSQLDARDHTVDSLTQEVRSLTVTLEEVQNQVSAALTDKEDQKKQWDVELTRQLQDADRRLQHSHKEELERAAAELKKVESKLEARNNEVDAVLQEARSLREALKEVQLQLSVALTDVVDLNKSLKEEQDTRTGLQAEVNRLQQEEILNSTESKAAHAKDCEALHNHLTLTPTQKRTPLTDSNVKSNRLDREHAAEADYDAGGDSTVKDENTPSPAVGSPEKGPSASSTKRRILRPRPPIKVLDGTATCKRNERAKKSKCVGSPENAGSVEQTITKPPGGKKAVGKKAVRGKKSALASNSVGGSATAPPGTAVVIRKRSYPCRYFGCDKHAVFGVLGDTPTRCGDHMLGGMIDVVHRQCKRCNKKPLYGFVRGQGLCCKTHIEKRMVNVMSRPCDHKGCSKVNPTFSYVGGKARFCFTHKKTGMRSIAKLCETVACTKRATFRALGQKARFCDIHKLPGMSESLPRCACGAPATFGCVDGKASCCFLHKSKKMIDLKNRR